LQGLGAENECTQPAVQPNKTACGNGEEEPNSMLLQVALHNLPISQMGL
jgi:hypothetical protein